MIVIAGKNNIAVHGLELALRKYDRNQIAVVCNKNETGVDGWQRSLRKFALDNQVQEITLEEAYARTSICFLSLEFDSLVVPERFKTENIFNIHFSLLPKYKGMFTSVWPIYNADKKSGVTLHYLDKGIDTGDVISQVEFSIESNWVSRDVYFAYIKYSCSLLEDNFESVVSGLCKGKPQECMGSTYYSNKSIDFSNLLLPKKATAWEYRNYIRAFSFREYQFVSVEGSKVVWAEILPAKSTAKCGELFNATKNYVDMASIDYDLRLYFDCLDEFLAACKVNDLVAVKRLRFNISGINDAIVNGWTPLIVASFFGSFEVVRYLLSEGADPQRPNIKGTTPLMYAKDAFFSGRCFKTFGLLMSAGADLVQVDYSGKQLYDYLTSAQICDLQKSLG